MSEVHTISSKPYSDEVFFAPKFYVSQILFGITHMNTYFNVIYIII